MSEPYIGEIKMFAGNFAPRGYAFCHGQLLPISQNTSLFSILGTTYGGDGRSTFALPAMDGRIPVHPGRGPGLTERRLGQKGGIEQATLSEAMIPNHSHQMRANTTNASTDTPASNTVLAQPPASRTSPAVPIYSDAANMQAMSTLGLQNTGGGLAHSNEQPYQAINFIVALQGVYPSRS